jgi:hypothetical protein
MLTRTLTAGAAAVGLACLLATPVSAARAVPAQTAARAVPARTADKLPSGAINQLISDLQKAQSLSTGRGVTVAVISSGVNPNDPSLAGKVTVGPNYALKPTVPLSSEYGNVVASIIAGSGPTGSQPLSAEGIAPDARILSIRAWPQTNERNSTQFYDNADYISLDTESINYAVSHGAQVIYIDDSTQGNLVDNMWKAVSAAVAKKVVIVAPEEAYGSTPNNYGYPPGFPGVIGVASIRLSGGNAPYDKAYSARNNAIVVTGPGNSIFGSGGWQIDGPGGAASIVAGVVALIKSLYPSLTDAQVEQALATSARYHPAGGYDTTIGFGLINPYGALTAAASLAKAAAPTAQGVAAGGHFGSGPVPPIIKAVHHSQAKLTAYSSAAGGGILVLLAALVLGLVWRQKARRRGGQATPPAFGPVPQFQQPPAWPPPPASGA